MVFLISDFQAESFEKPLRVLARRHDLIAVSLADARESKLPGIGPVELEDAETGELVLIDGASAEIRKRYEALSLARAGELTEMLRSMGIDQIRIETGRPYVRDMMTFFRNRERRRAHA